MKINVGLVLKIVVGIASVAIGLAEKAIADKELDAKVAKRVAEAFANQTGES